MATQKPVPIVPELPDDDPHEMVTIQLFRDAGRYKDPLYVSVNNRRFMIQRGVRVQVPRYVAAAIENSQKQDEATAAMVDELVRDYESNASRYQGA